MGRCSDVYILIITFYFTRKFSYRCNFINVTISIVIILKLEKTNFTYLRANVHIIINLELIKHQYIPITPPIPPSQHPINRIHFFLQNQVKLASVMITCM